MVRGPTAEGALPGGGVVAAHSVGVWGVVVSSSFESAVGAPHFQRHSRDRRVETKQPMPPHLWVPSMAIRCTAWTEPNASCSFLPQTPIHSEIPKSPKIQESLHSSTAKKQRKLWEMEGERERDTAPQTLLPFDSNARSKSKWPMSAAAMIRMD